MFSSSWGGGAQWKIIEKYVFKGPAHVEVVWECNGKKCMLPYYILHGYFVGWHFHKTIKVIATVSTIISLFDRTYLLAQQGTAYFTLDYEIVQDLKSFQVFYFQSNCCQCWKKYPHPVKDFSFIGFFIVHMRAQETILCNWPFAELQLSKFLIIFRLSQILNFSFIFTLTRSVFVSLGPVFSRKK